MAENDNNQVLSGTEGHLTERIDVQGLKASLQKLKTDEIDGKADKATTLSGYGITDAYTKTELETVISGTLKGSYSVVSVTGDATVSGVNPAQGTEIDILYVNNTNAEHIVTIPASTYRTNTGENLLLVIPAGWYAEANYSNIGGTIYVRGM